MGLRRFNVTLSKPLKSDRGIALLVTLSVITVLITVTLTQHRQVYHRYSSAYASADRLVGEQMAEAGLQAAMVMLVKDTRESQIDTSHEPWANAEERDALAAELQFDRGSVRFTISDELARIQINALVRYPEGQQYNQLQLSLWNRFMAVMMGGREFSEQLEPLTIINSLKDWLDFNDGDAVTGLNGAENDYYRNLDPPYECRNGPLQELNELRLVRGISDELFQGADKTLGLQRYLTVHGMTAAQAGKFTFRGRINLNTAELPVVAALLPAEHADLAEAIVEYRDAKVDGNYIHDLSSPTWYKEAPGCGQITINPRLLTPRSNLFRIEATAQIGDVWQRITVVTERKTNPTNGKVYCRVLTRQVEGGRNQPTEATDTS
jgi:general secretion pathway protein K